MAERDSALPEGAANLCINICQTSRKAQAIVPV